MRAMVVRVEKREDEAEVEEAERASAKVKRARKGCRRDGTEGRREVAREGLQMI